MKLRGRRECTECGERWSYFDTGRIECPNCGGIRSVALDEEPILHSASGAELDLTKARSAVEGQSIREVATLTAEASRSFLADRGFIEGGELQPLDDVTIATAELRQVADRVKRSMNVDEATEGYLLELLRGAPNGDRPDDIPPGLESTRGLGVADAVERYRTDMVRYLDANPDPDARRVLGILRDHLRRVEALDGDVSVAYADRLLRAARAVSTYLRGDEPALVLAEDHLSRL